MKVISLFSGAGGLDLGFILAGHTVIWANDNFHDAVETYKANLGDHILEGDISDVDSSVLPDGDIVIGGFPCQGFSVANTERSALDKRNKMYQEMIRIINSLRPKYFMAENVKGILSLNKGQVFRIILNDFVSMGYNVDFKVLNTADYGVPQTRERVIILGCRIDLGVHPNFPLPTHSEKGGFGLKKWVSVGDALKSLPDPDQPNDIANHTYSKYKLRFNGYLGNRTVDPERPAPTVTARGDDRGGVVILHHPNNKRRMTCRELASVQSFPTDYIFSGTQTSVYRQIGNAVPPLLGKAIADVFTELERNHA